MKRSTRLFFLALLLPATIIQAAPGPFRGSYQCRGGRPLSVSSLMEVNFIDNYHVELVFSAVRKPIYFPTTYRVIGNQMYIQHARNAVFTFKIEGRTLVGVSHPYEERTCAPVGSNASE